MNYTITCPGCGSKLKLFDSQVKQKQGFIRCTRCGQKIKYDLTRPDPVSTGFWADTEVPFKVGAQKRFLSIAKARQARVERGETPLLLGTIAPPETGAVSRIPQAFDRSQNHFQKFDMKTGQIIGETSTPAASSQPSKAQDFHRGNLPAPRKPVAAPPKPVKPMTETMKKLEELKHSLDSYTVTRSDHQDPPIISRPSLISRTPANIPITGRKAARNPGRSQSALSALRPLSIQAKTTRIQTNASLLTRLRTLFANFFQRKG